ncbi:MAG: FAD-dependent oxidoreductase [Acidimicrobiales bacterium]
MGAAKVWSGELGDAYDVVVVGSGAPGLTAALAAAKNGATVVVLEKADFLGGTSAVSGGMIWIPMNRCMTELGIADTRDDALAYLGAICDDRTPVGVLETLVDRGTEMQAFVETESDLRFETLENFPDYHPEWPGSHGGGRSLEPSPYHASEKLGDLFESLRPDHRPPFTMREYEEWRIFTRFPWEELAERAETGVVARGRALVAPLVKACADAGVTLVTGYGVRRLAGDGAGVTGVVGDSSTIAAAGGVVLACGGFEWSAEMAQSYLPGPIQGSCSPPHNTGDGIRMAAKVGSKLGNLNEAWWGPMVVIPGDETDGAPTSTLLRFERTGPGSIIVNRAGRRFVNEAHNYNDMTKAFHTFDPGTYTYANLPAWLIFDHAHLREYGFLAHRAGHATPEWLTDALSLAELATKIGVDPDGLDATVERFNQHAVEGADPDFHRGASAYDRYWGDDRAERPALGPLTEAPYYAIEVVSGVIGTKGGIVTDPDARALDAFDDPIPGLFAVGNTTAQPMGPGYAGAGSTLGPGMTMGYAAGLTASADAARPVEPAVVPGA